jgi:hypothetical protein
MPRRHAELSQEAVDEERHARGSGEQPGDVPGGLDPEDREGRRPVEPHERLVSDLVQCAGRVEESVAGADGGQEAPVVVVEAAGLEVLAEEDPAEDREDEAHDPELPKHRRDPTGALPPE